LKFQQRADPQAAAERLPTLQKHANFRTESQGSKGGANSRADNAHCFRGLVCRLEYAWTYNEFILPIGMIVAPWLSF
jgi:hypothetical protein